MTIISLFSTIQIERNKLSLSLRLIYSMLTGRLTDIRRSSSFQKQRGWDWTSRLLKRNRVGGETMVNLATPPVLYWLSEKGRRAVANLIRDERRKSWEWRIKVLTPILAILVSVLGLVIALVSLLLKAS